MSYRQSPGGTGSSPQWMNNLNMSPNDQFGDSIILNGGSCPRPVTPRTPVSERAGSCARPGLRTPQASIIQRSFERSVYTPNGTFDSFDSQPPGASTPAGPNQNASNNSGSSCSYAGPNTHTMFGTTGSTPHGHRYIPPGPVSPFVLADYVDGPASGTSAGDSTGYYEPTYSGSGGQGVNNGTYQVSSSSNSERSGICTCNAGGGCGSPVQMNNSSGSNRSSPRSGGYAAPQQTFGGNSGGPSHFSQPSPASSAGSPNSPPSANQSGGPLRASTPARDQQNSNISGGVPSGDNSRSSPGSLPVSSPQNTNGTGSAGFQTPSNASAAQRPPTPSGGMFISNTTGSGLNDSAGFQTPSNASAAQRPPTPSGGIMLAEPNDGTCGRGSKSPLAQPSTYRRRKRPPSCNNAVCVDGCTCERAQRGGPVELEGSNGQSCNAPPGQEPGGDAPVPIDPMLHRPK
ncbi:hypothetical protein Ocin01_00588 [Orchesella cincta]|uniref:Uncharacterized protein n=1 Tax=Orchesella cincta TaxID=48709 RepID=A0A1D2NLL0_ORCCI|nr:hypothetical protein Ocin01_00588 [Orchesella cincta]